MLKIIFSGGEALEVGKNEKVPISYSLADIKDVAKRTTTFSKNFNIVGSKDNNNLMSHYYDVRTIPTSFDTKKRNKVSLVYEDTVIMDNMFMSLIDVTVSSNQEVTYKVNLSTLLADFYIDLSEGFIRDLNDGWRSIDHIYTLSNVVNTFNNTSING